MDKEKRSHPRTYRPSKTKRGVWGLILIVFLIAFFIILFNLPTMYREDGLFAVIFFIGLFYGILSGIWYILEFIFKLKFEVTDNGLWLHMYGKRFYPWDSMISLGTKSRTVKYSSNWGIHTRKAKIIHQSPIGKWMIGNWIHNTFIPVEQIVDVPRKFLVSHDIEKFKQTEFGQDLYHYAPHLFEKYEIKSKKQKEDDYAIMEESSVAQEAFFDGQAQTQAKKR